MIDRQRSDTVVDGPGDDERTQPDLRPREIPAVADDDPTIETRALPDFGLDSGAHLIQPPRSSAG